VATTSCYLGEPEISAPQEQLVAFPNPATERLTLQQDVPAARLRIFDRYGKLVNEQDLIFSEKKTEINLAGLSDGLYLLQTTSGGKISAARIIVIH
jgi:hypothetical protein